MNVLWFALFFELLISYKVFACRPPAPPPVTHPRGYSVFYPESKKFGTRQTPINLIEGLNEMPKKIPDLVFNNYFEVPTKAWLHNRGSTIEFKAEWPSGKTPTIFGGAIPEPYIFDSFHFHWGPENCCGSEHLLQEKVFPMELHVIHKLPGLTREQIYATPNSLVVLGFFVSLADFSQFRPFTDYAGLVTAFNSTVDIPPFSLRRFIPAFQEYFTYAGSLTVAPFPENVIWIVSKIQLIITASEIEKFRTLRDSQNKPVLSSFRPPLPLGSQTLYFVMNDRIKFLSP